MFIGNGISIALRLVLATTEHICQIGITTASSLLQRWSMDVLLLSPIGATIPFRHVDVARAVYPLILYCFSYDPLGVKNVTYEW
jgi:hypothetical protein